MDTFIPKKLSVGKNSSVRKGLRSVVLELFRGLDINEIEIETRLTMSVNSFVNDFMKVFDEIRKPSDLQSFWHLSRELSEDLFAVSQGE